MNGLTVIVTWLLAFVQTRELVPVTDASHKPKDAGVVVDSIPAGVMIMQLAMVVFVAVLVLLTSSKSQPTTGLTPSKVKVVVFALLQNAVPDGIFSQFSPSIQFMKV